MAKVADPGIEGWTIDGYWWIGNDEASKTPGRLVFDLSNSISLQLNGTFSDDPSSILSSGSQVIEYINGVTTDGRKVCLTSCIKEATNLSLPGYASEKIQVTSVLIGINANSPDDLLFEKAYFEIDNLWPWLSPDIFSQHIDYNKEKGRVNHYTVTLTDRQYPVYEYKEYSITFHLRYSFNTPRLGTCSTITAGAAVGFSFNSPQRPQELVNRYASAIQEILCLAASKLCKIRKVEFRSARHRQVVDGLESHHEQNIQCLLSGVGGVAETGIAHGYLFTYKTIEADAQQIIGNWLDRRESMLPVFSLYFHHVRFGSQMLLQHAFLSLANCLEVYHRRAMQSADMDAHERRIEDIKRQVDGSTWEWLSGRLAYSYEPGLRKRLSQIYDRMPDLVKDAIGDAKAFIASVVNTRNYLTHYDLKLTSAVDDILTNALIYKMRMQIRVLFMLEMGLSGEYVAATIKTCPGFLRVPTFHKL